MSLNDIMAENLSLFMKEKKVSANTLAKLAGVTPSTVTRFLSREITSLNIDILQKVADYYNIDISYFFTGKLAERPQSASVLIDDIVYIDYYSEIGVAAGAGLDSETDGEVSSFPISKRFLLTKGVFPESACIVNVMGDSMQPTLADGDMVIVNKEFSPYIAGIYVIKDSANGLRVKRLDRDKNGNLIVISDNNKYAPQIYSQNEEEDKSIIIIGKVVAKIAGI